MTYSALRTARALAVFAAAAAFAGGLGVENVEAAKFVDTISALQTAVRKAPAGGTVYVRGGNYGSVKLSQSRRHFVTIRPAPGEQVTFADFDFGSRASHIRLRRLHISSQVTLDPDGARFIQILGSDLRGVLIKWGAHNVLLAHNNIHDCGNCVDLASTARNVHGAPSPTASNLTPVYRVTIRGNRIVRPNTDALYLTNFRHVRILGNEITGVNENGSHNDSLQTVWGGAHLTFAGNYVHDNRGQGFFIKDGRVRDVVVRDNLFVRVPGPFWQVQLYDTRKAVITRNTVWNVEAAVILRERDNIGFTVRNNVFDQMQVEQGAEGYYRHRSVLNQFRNLITGGYNWGATSRDRSVRPHFRNPGANDFRLTRKQVRRLGFKAGVTWPLRARHFGPH